MKNDIAIKSLENLSREERDSIAATLDVIGQKGPVVGVLPGSVSEGSRPILLGQSGALSMLRFIPVEQPLRDEALKLYSSIKASRACEAFGEHGGKIWLRRSFAPHTLASAEGLKKIKSIGPEKAAAGILDQIHSLHRKGLAHGHISLSNVGAFTADLSLLDAGVHAFSSGAAPTAESDLRMFLVLARDIGCQIDSEAYDEIVLDAARAVSISDCARVLPGVSSAAFRQAGPNIIMGAGKTGKIISLESGGAEEPIAEAPSITQAENRGARVPGGLFGARRIVAGAMIVAAVVAGKLGYDKFFPARIETNPEWESFWSSNQPSLMREVAKASIQDVRSAAAAIIVRDALSSVSHPRVQTKFLRLAFDPRWEGELSDDDRRMALTLGVGAVAEADTSSLKPLSDLHPAMAFSLMASTEMNKDFPGFADVQTSSLASLPPPIGEVFETLSGLGVESAADVQARGAAHIFSGDASSSALDGFFSGSAANGADLKKIQLLMPILEGIPKLADAAAASLSRAGSPAGKRLAWFDSTENVKWSELGAAVELSLAAGLMPSTKFDVDALSDLLSFPLDAVRLSAAAKLSERIPKDAENVVRFLAQGGHSFTRSQAATLVSILTVGGDKAPSYIRAWFDTKPNPLGVLALLAVRKDVRGDDVLNVESARYLKDTKWSAPFAVLKGLVDHPEPLLRAIIYSKLDPKRREDLELLKAMEKVEPSEKMREVIKLRIKSFEE